MQIIECKGGPTKSRPLPTPENHEKVKVQIGILKEILKLRKELDDLKFRKGIK